MTFVEHSFAQAESEQLQDLIKYRGPIPSAVISQLDSEYLDSLVKEFRRNIIMSRIIEGDPELKRTPNLEKVDYAIQSSLENFKHRFLQLKQSGVDLNEKNTRVYILGGGMEYYYFRASLKGIADFMPPENFRFIAVSRFSYTGGIDEAKEIEKYLEQELRQDLEKNKDIIFLDSVASGESLRSTHQLAERIRLRMNSESKITSFGIQEIPSPRKNYFVKAYGSIFNAATTKSEYNSDMKNFGWAYYSFSAKQTAVAKLSQLVPRFSINKFSDKVVDGYPEIVHKMPVNLPSLLKESSISNLLKNNQLTNDELLYLYMRIRALSYYSKSSKVILNPAKMCSTILTSN